ncbi:MAG TPA: AI-2E family transporter [Gemmatimonadaceae bacterium]|nr:AI-2E family transporter [Gemmatimonadaceae bacterium]
MNDQTRDFPPLGRLLLSTAGAVAVLAGMRAAASIIGPVLIALIITVAWSPGSDWLRKRGWHPSLAALTGIALGIIGIALFVALVWSSLLQLQDNLPGYQPRIEALQVLLRRQLSNLPIDTSRLFTTSVFSPSSIIGYALKVVQNVTQTAGNLFLLVLLMAFMMLEAVRYPQKLVEAFSSRPEVIARFAHFSESIRSYVGLNAVFGFAAAFLDTMLLLSLGVDFAILWGVLSFLLSFLPNIGFIIALTPPTLLALIQFGFGRSIAVLAGYIVINFIVDNVVKPRFVGGRLDLSPLVVVISLLFWGWLLGPMGALAAVPLSIGARFLFESFEESRWLAYLMSDAGPKPVVIDVVPDAEKDNR